jgi:hypothetical protein
MRYFPFDEQSLPSRLQEATASMQAASITVGQLRSALLSASQHAQCEGAADERREQHRFLEEITARALEIASTGGCMGDLQGGEEGGRIRM